MKTKPSAWLITHSFAPIAQIGGLRTLGLCRHLSHMGWKVSVICTKPTPNTNCDNTLLSKIPSDVKVLRTIWFDFPDIVGRAAHFFRLKQKKNKNSKRKNTFPKKITTTHSNIKSLIVDWLSWWLHVPDGRAGWLLPGWLAGLRHLRVNPPQVIFASAPSWTGLVVGYALSLTLGVPLVLDFRDPWCGSAFRTERVPYKTHRKAHEFLERIVLSRAVHVTCAWDGIRRLLIRRYPNLRGRITTVLNGFDPDDFSNLAPIHVDKQRCIFLHAGNFYGPRSPLPLLQALKYMVDKDMCAIRDALFVFLGQPTYNGYPLQDIIEQFSLTQYVRLLPSVPQRRAFAYLKGSHVAMLFGQSGSDELASIPAKAYEYIGLHKPVLAIGCGDEVCAVMESGGCPVWRVDSASTVQMSELLNRIISNFQNAKLPHAKIGAEQFTRLKMGERIRIILEGVVQ